MSSFTIGDFVVPRKGYSPFRSGGCSYDRAIVVSVLPWVIVSEEGDMMWSSTISVHGCDPAGHSNAQERKKAFARWERERAGNGPDASRSSSVTAMWRDERLVCAAERVQTNEATLVFTAAHHYQIHRMMTATGVAERGVQGFMTSLGRFVDRKEGREIAESKAQITARLYDSVSTMGVTNDLFSEEMWSLPQVDFDAMDANQSPDAAFHNVKLYKTELERMRKVCDEARVFTSKLQLLDQLKIDAAVREVLHTVGMSATRYNENDVAIATAIMKKHLRGGDGVREIDLDQGSWRDIKQAAMESKWIPPEYMKGDWVSDVCQFLREGNAPETDGDLLKVAKLIAAEIRGELPELGYLPDNDVTRKLLDEMRTALFAEEEKE